MNLNSIVFVLLPLLTGCFLYFGGQAGGSGVIGLIMLLGLVTERRLTSVRNRSDG